MASLSECPSGRHHLHHRLPDVRRIQCRSRQQLHGVGGSGGCSGNRSARKTLGMGRWMSRSVTRHLTASSSAVLWATGCQWLLARRFCSGASGLERLSPSSPFTAPWIPAPASAITGCFRRRLRQAPPAMGTAGSQSDGCRRGGAGTRCFVFFRAHLCLAI
jgi:hypothetical protein